MAANKFKIINEIKLLMPIGSMIVLKNGFELHGIMMLKEFSGDIRSFVMFLDEENTKMVSWAINMISDHEADARACRKPSQEHPGSKGLSISCTRITGMNGLVPVSEMVVERDGEHYKTLPFENPAESIVLAMLAHADIFVNNELITDNSNLVVSMRMPLQGPLCNRYALDLSSIRIAEP